MLSLHVWSPKDEEEVKGKGKKQEADDALVEAYIDEYFIFTPAKGSA
ncbi:MAG: hypothetical protein ACXABY_14350 [Candidatus Thorarchaeota archaeon]|jgi:hypothetical protein